MDNFYQGKKILVAGGTGLMGAPLVNMLVEQGAKVRVASLDSSELAHPAAEFIYGDLMNIKNCYGACDGQEIVFNLLGAKGSPKMNHEKQAVFFDANIIPNLVLLRTAHESGVQRFLYTSTVGVYPQAERFYEDIDLWSTFPSEKFPGWAKRMGELQAEAYALQYKWDKISIIRPTNTYGPNDNFDPKNAMVIPSLIQRIMEGENPLVVRSKNTRRDFLYAEDVARGMMLVVESGYNKPVNLGSGEGCTIEQLVNTIIAHVDKKPHIFWKEGEHSKDKVRVMDISRATALGWRPRISLDEGIARTMEWYRENHGEMQRKYNAFDSS